MPLAPTILHEERIPTHGVLVVPGRLDFGQLLEIESVFSKRRITWLIEESAHHDPVIRAHLEKSNSGAMFSIADAAPEAAGKELKSYLDGGGVLIHVPGTANTRNATPCHIPSAELRVLCSFGLPILPIAIDCPHESALSIENTNALPSATIVIGQEISAASVSIATYRQALLAAHEEAFSQHALLDQSLAMALLEGLKKHGKDGRIIDGADDSDLGYDKILAAALAFSRLIREETDQLRVAIVLPPGKAGLIANLAVIFAGKIPVNFNFTAGPDAVRSAIRQSAVDRFITADPFVRRVPTFPWPPNRDLIFIERAMPSLKKKIILWAVISKILPAKLINKFLKLDARCGNDEAVLLFTSGSSGEPKGVALSHRNVLANVSQFGSRLDLPAHSSMLGCLPLFHSFGSTVTLWFPVIQGVNLVTYPSPLETKRLAELIAIHQVDVLLSTPTFMRGFMKRVDSAQLASLKLVVTGAEKLPQSLSEAFNEKFGVSPQEGYGLTETSPATNVNLPDPADREQAVTIPSSRIGTVGQLLPGIAIRMTDPTTDDHLTINQQGMIWLKGANIFQGYLGNPEKSAEVLVDGWFKTGDVGRVDDEGFLHIEGRISRFSKIGGEMVPHETIESAINKALGLDAESERRIAIVGLPDPQKGEVIVLLSSIQNTTIDCTDLRYKLLEQGIPSLWCPKTIIPVAEIPVLASGKLDIKRCETLAKSTR
ncbi:MAG: 2-acyl-glycerophospho-ethanolamine acyltransferase [Verrucomicrobiia bacterium Tous-C5FEB]|nr:MAG: 2-acyl-glycerophospho-ethanolamine acyltransferase [Verrucomicrobiae bacterium Tous-C5FEB]